MQKHMAARLFLAGSRGQQHCQQEELYQYQYLLMGEGLHNVLPGNIYSSCPGILLKADI
jgi:hypothetical protein